MNSILVPFMLGFTLMWAAQLGLVLFGWSRGNAMTVSGVRIHWDNARFRDLVFVLRLVAGGVLAAWTVPSFPETMASVYLAGIVIAFVMPAVSEIPVVLMKRWGIEPPLRSGPSSSNGSKGKRRSGRDL